MTEQLALFARSPDPPLLRLLRELCTGTGKPSSHPCPDGVCVEYVAWADGNAPIPETLTELRLLRIMGAVESHVDDDGDEVWRAL